VTGWRLRLKARSAGLIGGVSDAGAGVHAATAFFEGFPGRPLALPGTSLRGVLRDAFGRFAAAKEYPCEDSAGCGCPTCHLFGRAERSGAIWVRTAVADGSRHAVAGVSIHRRRRTAAREVGALWVEERGLADFDVDVATSRPITDEERALLDDFWAWLALVGLSVGRRKTAGVGRFDVEVLPSDPPTATAPSIARKREEARSRYLIRLTLLEPTRLVGPRQRDFYREGLDLIPIPTLRGALGWALERLGASEALTDLFVERPILLTPGFPVSGDVTEIPPWLARYRCGGEVAHVVDGALDRVADAMLHADSSPRDREPLCPQCGSELRQHTGVRPRAMVMGHVSLDPRSRRARRGDLHYQVVLGPGNVFASELLARPSQVEALRSLETVLVGGRRARGQGLARLEIQELPALAPVADRIEATRSRLVAEYGIDDRIAVLGVLTDAATDRPLTEILRAAGLELVTGEVRDVVRGGWDERSGGMRPLRRLLAAGSWLAVRIVEDGALEALEALEREGIADPEGTAPLLLRVRDDWEVTAMTPQPASTVSTVELDDLVREVRKLCADAPALPERAALQTLLRFARSTPSVEETVLFIEYQASRDQFRAVRPFLQALAEMVRSRYPSDADGARRLLGLVVRAGNVERERRKGDGESGRQRSRPSGSRQGGGRDDRR
jgi:hypothetical protein